MRSLHIILAMHVSYGLAHFVRLKSTKPLEFTDNTGCRTTSIQLCYECTRELNDTFEADLPQLFSFRLDCRGAKGNFQNLTLFDSHPYCGHLTYRKYGNSSVRNPTSHWLPLISDEVVTIEKGEVLDFQCVLRSLEIYSGIERQRSSPQDLPELAAYSPKFDLIRDGVKTIYYSPLYVEMRYLSREDRRPCIQSLAKVYEWKMTVAKSRGLTYWVSYGTPVLQPQILPEVQFSSELRGEVYRLDKDLLRLTLMEVTSYNSWKKPQDTLKKLVELDDNFYGDAGDGESQSNHSFSVDFKLRVNPDLLRSDTKDVVVVVSLRLGPWEKPSYFHVTLPTNRDQNSSGRWPWLIVVFLIVLVFLAYVFREQLFMLQAFQLLWRRSAGLPPDETGVSIIELQS